MFVERVEVTEPLLFGRLRGMPRSVGAQPIYRCTAPFAEPGFVDLNALESTMLLLLLLLPQPPLLLLLLLSQLLRFRSHRTTVAPGHGPRELSRVVQPVSRLPLYRYRVHGLTATALHAQPHGAHGRPASPSITIRPRVRRRARMRPCRTQRTAHTRH